jgi:hypothetical protein
MPVFHITQPLRMCIALAYAYHFLRRISRSGKDPTVLELAEARDRGAGVDGGKVVIVGANQQVRAWRSIRKLNLKFKCLVAFIINL